MDKISNIEIGGLDFEWNLEQGQFIFEKQDSVLFWITSAMRSFFDTIEEISGDEAANLVLETSGFRQGLLVGNYFNEMKHVNVEEASLLITNTYASAGWGIAIIEGLDVESKTFSVKFKNSWENKINKVQGKKLGSNFIPAHYAGIYTSLFNTNIWYEVVQSQLDGHEYSIVNYLPSDITIVDNIHELARKKDRDLILQLEALVEDKTRELYDLVKKLSSPMIPVLDGIVVVPLIGKFDEDRSEELVVTTLHKLPDVKAKFLILDLTGLHSGISKYTASLILKIGFAAEMIGTKTILVGISPQLSTVITQSGLDLSTFDCFNTLQHGIHYALSQQGRRIV